jgi:hypothetical protein
MPARLAASLTDGELRDRWLSSRAIECDNPDQSMKSKLLSILALLLAVATPSFAEQFVLFDVTFAYTKGDAMNATPSKSHYYVKGPLINPERPKDWTSPVDYRNGTLHVRLEVLDKPAGGEGTQWNICYIPNKGQNGGYGCTSTGVYTEKGVYDKDISMTSFWHNDGLVWEQGVKQIDLVLKDAKGVKVHERPDPEKFVPTKIRMTVVQVSAGAKYDPALVPQLKAPAK